MSDPIEILDFWLGEVGPDGWYAGGEALDGECLLRFGDIWQAARDGGLDHWVEGTVGTLAYLILCDQLSRNMHRGSADSFATDGLALAAACALIVVGAVLGDLGADGVSHFLLVVSLDVRACLRPKVLGHFPALFKVVNGNGATTRKHRLIFGHVVVCINDNIWIGFCIRTGSWFFAGRWHYRHVR